MTTNYYLDGAKILGESRTDGGELRYFYDHDGLIGFRFGVDYYGYIKDAQGSIVAIVDNFGNLIVQYEYDSFGKTTKKMIVLLYKVCVLLYNNSADGVLV